jgi:hypothetical protein
MDTSSAASEVEGLLVRLRQAQDRAGPEVKEWLAKGQELRDAVREVANSSSGSWVGWHSRMYYADFREPPVQDSWDTEWGGHHGFSNLWQERSQDEVQAEVERRAQLGLADLAAGADRVREICEPLQEDTLTVLSPILDLAGLEQERKLLDKIEDIDWIVSPANFMEAIRPTQIMSRDTAALHQGMQAPLHLNVEVAIVSNTSTLSTSRDFLRDAIRICRQVQTKLRATAATPGAKVEDAGITSSARLRRQLQRRSWALFALLALAVVAAVVAALSELDPDRLTSAALIVGGALALAGLYALLVNRAHAVRALVAAGAIGGAVAAVDQFLSHFE